MSIVTSQLARKLLELDAGPSAPLAPIEVLPLAVPAGPVPSRSTETVPPLVVTLGRQEDAKQPEVLIDALGSLNRTQPVRLAVVGQIRPDLSSRLRRRIDAAGLNGMVEVMGFVSDQEYRDLINRATCAVQLRRNSTGEGSAAVGDALAAGVPVITNIPSSSEFPDGTLERVPDNAGPDAIAREIQQLIDDPQRRRRLSNGALRYAQSWSFDNVATRLLELVLEDIRRADAAPHAVIA
jgi:glycosyltransferase involved in cell wall biosynthesis